jgi:hypothetical protein
MLKQASHDAAKSLQHAWNAEAFDFAKHGGDILERHLLRLFAARKAGRLRPSLTVADSSPAQIVLPVA